jgi:ParB-like chromosome segregation protein Spo0J
MRNLSIEQTPILALKAQDRNARTHTNRQIRQIANSIKRFGFTNPILTDDKLQILAGYGRVEAAKVLGMTIVPTIRLSDMTEAEKRAYVIADNAIALKAGWDREILALEMHDLINLGFERTSEGREVIAYAGPWTVATAGHAGPLRAARRSAAPPCGIELN